ncbi:MAG: hypothetical protein ACRDYC_01515 [Acidimicrobiales bacterium]
MTSVPKVLLSLDDQLLVRIDQAARSAGVSRSAYIADLAARQLGEERGPGASNHARRAIERLQRLFDGQPARGEATAAIRAERDAR